MSEKAKIIRNAAQCRRCLDEIESKYRHDWVSCKCGAIFVDGGKDYCRRGGNPEDFLDLTEVEGAKERKGTNSLE